MFAQPEIDLPHIVEAEIISMIEDIRNSHPRSNQKAMGPSEVGHPCARKLIHRLARHKAPRGFVDGWFAQIGTFGHAGLEAGVAAYQAKQGWAEPRYLLEHAVTVGSAAGEDISGHADLFDVDSGTVIDYKFVGPEPMKKYKLHGPGVQYRTQAHLYGRGFALQGYTVNQVMISFLPRNGALGSSRFKRDNDGVIILGADGLPGWADRGSRFFWSEPYDESIALAALARLNGLAELLKLMGADALLDMYPECTESFCPWCGR